MRTFADHLVSLSQLVYDHARELIDQRVVDPADLALRMHRIGANLQDAAARFERSESPRTECHIVNTELRRLVETVVERRLYSATDVIQLRQRYDRLRHGADSIFDYVASNPVLLVEVGVNHGDPARRSQELDRLRVIPVNQRRDRAARRWDELRVEFGKLELAGRYFLEVGRFIHAGVRAESA